MPLPGVVADRLDLRQTAGWSGLRQVNAIVPAKIQGRTRRPWGQDDRTPCLPVWAAVRWVVLLGKVCPYSGICKLLLPFRETTAMSAEPVHALEIAPIEPSGDRSLARIAPRDGLSKHQRELPER